MSPPHSRVFLKKIGYHFNDLKLIVTALTHRSVEGAESNERLEFLGDGIVNFVIAIGCIISFLAAQEGELSRLRATLVNRETLMQLAQSMEIAPFLQLVRGKRKVEGCRVLPFWRVRWKQSWAPFIWT